MISSLIYKSNFTTKTRKSKFYIKSIIIQSKKTKFLYTPPKFQSLLIFSFLYLKSQKEKIKREKIIFFFYYYSLH